MSHFFRIGLFWGLGLAISVGDGPSAAGLVLELVSAPRVSPDGGTAVFEWCHDLWAAPSGGGEAVRLVAHPARDGQPWVSPDGKRLVFQSDRSGVTQVYSMSLAGGEVSQHSFHGEGCELAGLSPDGQRALVMGQREIPGTRGRRLLEIRLDGDFRERRVFDAEAESAQWSPDGQELLFCRGGEQLYRKGYRGARAAQIWKFQVEGRKFSPEVVEPTESLSPLWAGGRGGYYYVSERDGTRNLWWRSPDGKDSAVTRFRGDGVVMPAISADGGTILFRRGFEVFRLRPAVSDVAEKVVWWTRESLPLGDSESVKIRRTTQADFHPDHGWVFAAAGELWWKGQADRPAQRLTESPDAEERPQFSPDGKWLAFSRDDGLETWIYRARLDHGVLAEITKTVGGKSSMSGFRWSPDGTKIAWISGRGDVWTAAADGTTPRLVFPLWNRPSWDWSPDARWLVIAAEDRHARQDLWLVAADGSRPPLNLTRTPAEDSHPTWSPDGRSIVFRTRWDVTEKGTLRRIKFDPTWNPAQLPEAQVLASADHAETLPTRGIDPMRVMWTANSKALLFQSAQSSSKKLYQIGLDGKEFTVLAHSRGLPVLCLQIGADSGLHGKKGSGTLDFTRKPIISPGNNCEGGLSDLSLPAPVSTPNQGEKIGDNSGLHGKKGSEILDFTRKPIISPGNNCMDAPPGGGALAWLVGGVPEMLCGEVTERFPVEGAFSRSRAERLRLGFRRVWRTLQERFYEESAQGLNWEELRNTYEPVAMRSRDSRQFDRVINQFMGNLNASHLTFQRELWPEEFIDLPKPVKTAHPGWIFDDTRQDGPLIIRAALPGAPTYTWPGNSQDGPVGWEVRRIAGVEVNALTPLHRLFQGAEDRALPVVLRSPGGQERTIELRCISYTKARARWTVGQREMKSATVVRDFPGAIYLAAPHMDRATLDSLALQLHRLGDAARGLVLDVRNNDGGREADQLLAWFSQPAHAFTRPRGGPSGYPAERLPTPVWRGPLVVLCNEHTFSNAEIFCHAIQAARRGPLVGTSTAGGVISAVSVTIPETGRVQVPFRGWFRKSDGQNLDLHGAVPDVSIPLRPADEDAGHDPQLAAALAALKSALAPSEFPSK